MKQDFLPSDHSFSDCICRGTGATCKYYKEERKEPGKKPEVIKVDQVRGICPLCHPNLAQPFIPGPGQVEIGYEEFMELRQRLHGG